MSTQRSLVAVAAIVPFLLAACSSDDSSVEGRVADSSAPVAETDNSFASLSEMEGVDLVDHLEATALVDRPNTIMASVRADEVQLSDMESGEDTSVALPDDEFYLSFAPYVNQTHECYFHSLTSCVGELQNVEMNVEIVSSDGDVLFDETVTSNDNGFTGIWLPVDIEATLTVEYDGKTGTAEIATGDEDPTCLTTLELS